VREEWMGGPGVEYKYSLESKTLGRGVGEGWARGGLITSFSIYVSHVKKFTSKIKKNYDGFKIAGVFWLKFFCYEVFAKL
jgi:hypothetical protein